MKRVQRLAAYNVCVDDASRLLVCRLSAITTRAGAWTLPGGGVEFGEHPEATALRELKEETGLDGRVLELLAVDSITRTIIDPNTDPHEYHSVRIVYRTEIVGGELAHEVDGSSDHAAWLTHAELAALDLLETGALGVRLAFGT